MTDPEVSIDTRRGRLGESVRARIEELVLNGAIGAGERVNELSLATQFNISRGPVREALRALEHAGLLVSIPNRGMFVKKVDLTDALNLYDVRAGLARVAGRLVAQRVSAQQLESLHQAFETMQVACEARDTAAFYATNLHFHSQLIDYAANPSLSAISDAVRNELQLHLRHAVIGPAQLKTSQAEHRAILDAIAAGDAERAGAGFEAHILAGKQRMLVHMRSGNSIESPLPLAP